MPRLRFAGWSRGDTMIEVLLAITIFSAVSIGALTIMNQGAASAQRSLELSLVRNEIDAQAEALRVMYDDVVAARALGVDSSVAQQWDRFAKTSPGNFGKNIASSFPDAMLDSEGNCVSPSEVSGAFFVDTRKMKVAPADASNSETAQVYSQINYPDVNGSGALRSYGLWVEAESHVNVVSGNKKTGYIDFHIRACWDAVGQAKPATLGTIVRLYEPAE